MIITQHSRTLPGSSRAWYRALLLLCWIGCLAGVEAQDARFTVFKGGDAIGQILTSRTIEGGRTTYETSSFTQLVMLWKQVVKSSMGAVYKDGALLSCDAKLIINGSLRDSSRMATRNDGRWAYVHPGPPHRLSTASAWTTSRMYYEEPMGQASIFVESVLQDCPLARLGPGLYELTFPNNDRNRYQYVGGRLMEVQVDRMLINLTFKRA